MDFLILSGNTIVAQWKENKLDILNDSLLPLYLKNTSNVGHLRPHRTLHRFLCHQ